MQWSNSSRLSRMTTIYRDIIDGTRELLASVMDNRLNTVMKYLTSITLVTTIPQLYQGIYGMNLIDKEMGSVCESAIRI